MRRFALLVSTFAILSAPAFAGSLSERNFTFVPAGKTPTSAASTQAAISLVPPPNGSNTLPAMQVDMPAQPPIAGTLQAPNYTTSIPPGARNGMGQTYEDQAGAAPQLQQAQPQFADTPKNIGTSAVPNSMLPQSARIDNSGTPAPLPPVPPQTKITRYDTAPSTVNNPAYLYDGQIFHGITSMPQQANFYTVVARNEAEFVDIWQQHIGMTAPTSLLGPGQAAIFATSGPKSFTGYDVNLKLFGENAEKVQVLATELMPSSVVAQTRGEVSPWQIIIVKADQRPIEVLQRKAMAGSTVH